MGPAQCGFDPTITTKDGQRFVEIERNCQVERLIEIVETGTLCRGSSNNVLESTCLLR